MQTFTGDGYAQVCRSKPSRPMLAVPSSPRTTPTRTMIDYRQRPIAAIVALSLFCGIFHSATLARASEARADAGGTDHF